MDMADIQTLIATRNVNLRMRNVNAKVKFCQLHIMYLPDFIVIHQLKLVEVTTFGHFKSI